MTLANNSKIKLHSHRQHPQLENSSVNRTLVRTTLLMAKCCVPSENLPSNAPPSSPLDPVTSLHVLFGDKSRPKRSTLLSEIVSDREGTDRFDSTYTHFTSHQAWTNT
ncbi:hypothetical protein BLOT_014809 [Blomia tropicalis]|nr:hypothetical protein BLOT_014809 [Blomia tropicalis]